MAHMRQSKPDSSLGFQVKVLATLQVVPSSLGSAGQLSVARTRRQEVSDLSRPTLEQFKPQLYTLHPRSRQFAAPPPKMTGISWEGQHSPGKFREGRIDTPAY
jgi:hypothetical protein